jgi:pyrroline-5-carboxylate reductase
MFKILRKKIGIIGYGNMGSAIAERVSRKYYVVVFDKDKNKTQNLRDMQLANNTLDLVSKVDVVILAVKPQDFEVVLNEVKERVKDKLVISIAAGIKASYIERRLNKVRVIRVMPNLPAKVGEGMITLCKGQYAHVNDLSLANELFSMLGKTLIINEDKMDSATAVSGSGPGFFFALIQPFPQSKWEEFGNNIFTPALIGSAERVGFSTQEAFMLASATTSGSIALLRATKSSPEALCIQVASEGGTTEAGLKALQEDIEHLPEAVAAAKKRAEELSKI